MFYNEAVTVITKANFNKKNYKEFELIAMENKVA